MTFIEQCKGKEIQKIAKSKLLDKEYYASTKYDGNYVQIHKKGNKVKFYTSGGKEFYVKELADEIISMNNGLDFILETEYISVTQGLHGGRGQCTTTSWRSQFDKNEVSEYNGEVFKVFDLLKYNNGVIDIGINHEHHIRWERAMFINLPKGLQLVKKHKFVNLAAALKYSSKLRKRGWEGSVLVDPESVYCPGKRVNNIIKIKPRPTADLLCIGVRRDGSGAINGLLVTDSKNRRAWVGSGLSDIARSRSDDYYKNKILEIEYEQVIDTYQHCVLLRVREDKDEAE